MWFTGDDWRESAYTSGTKISGSEWSLQERGKNRMRIGNEKGLCRALNKAKTLLINLNVHYVSYGNCSRSNVLWFKNEPDTFRGKIRLCVSWCFYSNKEINALSLGQYILELLIDDWKNDILTSGIISDVFISFFLFICYFQKSYFITSGLKYHKIFRL